MSSALAVSEAWAGTARTQRVSPTALLPHPLNAKLFAHGHEAEDRDLLEDIRRNGILRALVVCGDECARPRGTVLGGHRRRNAAIALGFSSVEATYLDGLSADQEAWHLVLDNRRDQRSRDLRHSELYAMEEQLRVLHGKRQGHRSDRDEATCVAANASLARRSDTSLVLARLTGEPSNAIKNRRTVFQSPFVSDGLREELDARVVPLTRVASAVRRLRHDPKARSAYESRDAQQLGEVQRRLENELHARGEPKEPAWLSFVRRALHDLEQGDASRARGGLQELLAHAEHGVDA